MIGIRLLRKDMGEVGEELEMVMLKHIHFVRNALRKEFWCR